ncbi:heparinase II/III family protein [Hydrogenophaga sp.]|uniref:heparinase II/III family protein n=2 Tax=Hydrogenophaga sp. TaxID=1904254 RepID=UPI003D0E6458
MAGDWTTPARRQPSMTQAGRFIFLNRAGDLDRDGWDGPGQEKLWRYNQHYFDDLNALESVSRLDWHRQLVASWVAQNPPGTGTGWESYPTSLRIVNWIKWSLEQGVTEPSFLDSLFLQVRWLARRLETHLLGNHLFVNAKALVFAGAYFSGDEAASWRRIGFGILRREIPEQILPDGGQFERSPMYHALAYEDMLDLYNLRRCFAPDAIWPESAGCDLGQETLARMRTWLHTMCHPNGELALFNDTAADVAPSVQELDAYAQRLGLPPSAGPQAMHLAHSGYIRLQQGEAIVLFDAAPVGPDYLPAHAHADTLSLELSLRLTRVIVNSGTSVYAEGSERSRQRSTAAHSTVVIDQQDSSEVWGSFRVARRARPHDVHVELERDRQHAFARHDGYCRLPGRATHARSLTLVRNGLLVEDAIEGNFDHAQSRFHFHPGVLVEVDAGGQRGACHLPDGSAVTWHAEGSRPARVEASTWHPAFGVSVTNCCLVLDWATRQCAFQLHWNDASAD